LNPSAVIGILFIVKVFKSCCRMSNTAANAAVEQSKV
jgi:hypothetical protein